MAIGALLAGGAGVAIIISAVDNYSRGFLKAQGAMAKFGAFAGAALATVGIAATVATGIAIKKFASFDEQMINSMNMFDSVTEQEREAAEKLAKTLSVDLAMGADDAAKAFWSFGSAGMNVEDTMGALPDTLLFAKVNLLETGEAANFAMTAMKVFGIESDDMGKTLDTVTKAMKDHKLNMQQMADSFTYVAPLAAQFGMSIAEAGTLTGVLADAGITGSMAGTTLRKTFISLAAPTGAAAAALDNLGIQVWSTTEASKAAEERLGPLSAKMKEIQDLADSGAISQSTAATMLKGLNEQYDKEKTSIEATSGPMRNMIDIIGDIEKKTGKLSESQKAQFMQNVFGTRSVSGLAAIMDVGADSIKEMSSEAENATGVMDEMQENMEEGLGYQFDQLKSQIGVAAIELGDVLAPAIMSGMQSIRGFVAGFDPEKISLFISQLGGVLMPIFQKMQYIFEAIQPAITAIWEGMVQMFETIRPYAESFIDTVLTVIQQIFQSISTWAEENKPMLTKMFEALGTAGAVFFHALENVVKVFKAIWDIVIKLGLLDLIVFGVTAIATAFSFTGDAVNAFLDVLLAVFDGISTGLDNLGGWFEIATTFIGDVWNGMTDGFTDAWNAVGDMFETVWTAMEDFGVNMINSMSDAISGFINFFIAGINAIIDARNKVADYFGWDRWDRIPDVNLGHIDTEKLDDFIISNGQVYETNPNDTIMGSKTGFGGGGATVNIENVYGIDPENIAIAIQEQLTDKILI